MAYKTPDEITEAATDAGVAKAQLPVGSMLVGGFLGGAYIALAGLVAIAVSSGLDPETWGTLPTLFTGVVFVLGLVLVVVAGAELLTGNMALLPLAALRGRLGGGMIARNFAVVTVANLLGALLVAYLLGVKSGVLTSELELSQLTELARAKTLEQSSGETLLRAIGCNWLVCLGVWMALGAEDIGGKILAIFFPVMAFVAMGFDHVVANMFFLPAAMFADVAGIGWGDVIRNLGLAFVGNLVGAGVFVAGAYHYLYGRDS